MDKIMEKLNKLSLPITILIASVILGGVFFATQVIKQQSIEKQQQQELQTQKKADQAKAEQDQKEYAAKQKSACLTIYETEGGKWNNVKSWNYNEKDDECGIVYSLPEKDVKSDAECQKELDERTASAGDSSATKMWAFSEYFDCVNGTFHKYF